MIACPKGCGRTFKTRPAMSGHARWCDGESYKKDRQYKKCARCRASKPVERFRVLRVGDDGFKHLDAYCHACESARDRDGGTGTGRTRKTCTTCKKRKGAIAFRRGAEVCRKCSGEERVRTPTKTAISYIGRPSYEEWARMHRITPTECEVLGQALDRYGRSGEPCADAIIEAHTGPEVYVQGGPMRRSAILRHAVVLLANERARYHEQQNERAA